MKPLTLLLLAFGLPAIAFSQSINVQPYLQDAEPTSMRVMWETTSGDESLVEWGLTQALGNSTTGISFTGSIFSRIHDTQITGLQPNTLYYYRVSTETAQSAIFDFKTPALQSDEASINFIAMSDMQQDIGNPGVFDNVINQGVIPFVENRYQTNVSEALSYTIIPGDLVDNDILYSNWENTFFDPAASLFRHVPVYPVAGNHEYLSLAPAYIKYFHLPDNGSTGNSQEEHWWYKDVSNVRLIGLESNGSWANQTQIDWLQVVLDDACSDNNIDFIFAQIHHPFHSELWPPGESDYTGTVMNMLENFSTDCGKPSAHFFGHTHGYSRGQSKEHNHLMVDVATAGGNIDYWGEYNQIDYPEFSRSDDAYGFVLMEVEAGNNPQFKLTRVSTGQPGSPLNNVIRDSVLIKLNNAFPDQPIGIFPPMNSVVAPECLLFQGGAYNDPDGDMQGAVQWQIATDAAFTAMVYDEWHQFENWFGNVDLEAGNNMTEEEITILDESTSYFWRVRYRDRSLGWSDWSEIVNFQTSGSSLTANLLLNGDAENGTADWIQDAGSFESNTSGECGGIDVYAGSRMFVVGGVCNNNSYAEGHQDVDVSSYNGEISTGGTSAQYGGYLSDFDGDDHPEFKLQFLDVNGVEISTTPNTGSYNDTWTLIAATAEIPSNTETIRMILSGTRSVGFDNDCYFDNMYLKLNLTNGCLESVPVGYTDMAANNAEILAYPNPFSNNTTIEVLNAVGSYKLHVFSSLGRIVYDDFSENGKFRINRQGWANGIYLYRVYDQNGVVGSGKLLVN